MLGVRAWEIVSRCETRTQCVRLNAWGLTALWYPFTAFSNMALEIQLNHAFREKKKKKTCHISELLFIQDSLFYKKKCILHMDNINVVIINCTVFYSWTTCSHFTCTWTWDFCPLLAPLPQLDDIWYFVWSLKITPFDYFLELKFRLW